MDMPLTGETRVNLFASGAQTAPKVATLLDGTLVAIWQSAGQDGSFDGVYAQRFTAQGERIGVEFRVAETAFGGQQDPSIAATDDGGFVAVWTQDAVDVFARRFDAAGAPQGGDFRVNAVNLPDTQDQPTVVGVPGGGFAIAFSDDDGDGSNNQGVRLRVYDAAGVPAANDVALNVTTAGSQGSAHLAAIQPSAAPGLSAGGVAAVWSGGGPGDGSGITLVLLDAAGTALTGEIQVNATTSAAQTQPVVAGLLGGRVAVAFRDGAADGSGEGVFVRVFEADGTPVNGADVQVNVETSSYQRDPSIIATSDGGFVVAWTSNNSGGAGDGSGDAVFGRRFDADGTPTTGEFRINEFTSGSQNLPSLAPLAGGDFAAVFASASIDGDGFGVSLRLLGDDLAYAPAGARPELEAVSLLRAATESEAFAGIRLDADAAAALSDADSADFDGGRLVVSVLDAGAPSSERQFSDQDADGQILFVFETGGASPVTVAAGVVSVGGVAVGSIVSGDVAGEPLIVELNADADAAAVEALVERVVLRNLSDDPRPQTVVSLQLEDGSGATSDPLLVTVNITPETDIDGAIRPEIRINSFIDNTQRDPEVATLFDPVSGDPDGFVAVWTSVNQDGTNDDGVFAQRFDADGLPLGLEFQVNQTVASSQFDAQAVGLADGGFVIVWVDDNDGSSDGIFLTRYDANGAPVAGNIETIVNEFPDGTLDNSSGNQTQPRIVATSDTSYQVVWTSATSGAAGDGSGSGIFSQLYNIQPAGVGDGRVGGPQQVNFQTDGDQTRPEIAALGGGRSVVVWESVTNGGAGDGSGDGIYARLFASNGTAEAAAEIAVNETTLSNQTDPQVAVLGNGDFVVAWRSEGQDGSSGGIYYRRFDTNGTALTGDVRVNDSTSGNQNEPTIAALSDGGFVIGWTDTSTPAPGSGADVFAQVFDADGTRLDTEVRLNDIVVNTQENLSLAPLGNGGYVAVWESNGNPSGGFTDDIQAKVYGDPADYNVSEPPVLTDFPELVETTEAAANGGVLLSPTISLADPDSADLSGGRLLLTRLVADANAEDFNAPDDETQDTIGFDVSGAVSIVGGVDLQVDLVSIGTIVSDGVGGAPLQVDFNAGATPDRVETAIKALTYVNASDDPRDSRSYTISLTDGDGGITTLPVLEIRVSESPDVGGPSAATDERQVNALALGAQDQPDSARLNDGGWVVAWRTENLDADGTAVYAQRYNADGSLNGASFQVNSIEAGAQGEPVVAGLSNGGFVIAWTSAGQGGSNDIAFQIYDSGGAAVGAEQAANTFTPGSQDQPAIAADPSGDFALLWRSNISTTDGSSSGIVFRRFQNDGTPDTAEVVANAMQGGTATPTGGPGTSGAQSQPAVAVLANGQTIAIWTSANGTGSGDGSGSGVFGRLINADGSFDGDEFQINQVANSNQDQASVAATATGFVVAYRDASGQDGSSSGVQARFFDLDGTPQTDEFTVNESRANDQTAPDVDVLSDGRVLVTWRSNTAVPGGSGVDVAGQILSATGARIDGEFLVNQQVSSTQDSPVATALDDGDFVIVWRSDTSGGAGDGDGSGVFQRIYGDPADYPSDSLNVIVGFDEAVTLDEAEVNAGLVRIDLDKAAAVPDLGVSDFDGGSLTISLDRQFDPDPFPAPDGPAQHSLGFIPGDVGNGAVSLSGATVGSDVSVDGVVVGQIGSDGRDGADLRVDFNAAADEETVEALLSALGYENASSDPEGVRYLIDVDNGAGGATRTISFDIAFVPEDDAGLSAGPERRVNAHTQGSQEASEIVQLAGGGHAVVWQSTGQDELPITGSIGIYAQVYDVDGDPVGPEIRVNTVVAGTQSDPAVAALSTGGFVVVWTGINEDNGVDSDTGILAQRFTASGAADGAAFVVNSTVADTQFDPSVAGFASGGGFVVTYRSDQSIAGGSDSAGDSILAQVFDGTGAPVGAEVQVNTTTPGDQSAPVAAGLQTAGGAHAGHVVVWRDGGGADGADSGVFAQIYDASGAATGSEFQVNGTTAGSQTLPAVAAFDNGGGFVVAWQDDGADGGSNGIYAQRFTNAGAPVGSEFLVNDTTASAQSNPSVAVLDNGGFAISWNGAGPGDGDGVYVQIYDAAGARVDGEQRVNVQTSSTQDRSSIAANDQGGFNVAWSAFASGGSGDGSGYAVVMRSYAAAPVQTDAPDLDQVTRYRIVTSADVTSAPVVLDDSVNVADPDAGGFDGGELRVYYTRGPGALDQLEVLAGGRVSLNAGDLEVDGTVIGAIDAVEDGVDGADLVIALNAAATAEAVRLVVERVAFSSDDLAANVVGQDRSIGFVLTDGAGEQSEPASIYLDINGSASAPSGLQIDDFGDDYRNVDVGLGSYDESVLIAAPVVLDPSVDFDDFIGGPFDGGRVVAEIWSGSAATHRLSVLDQGTGPGQIGFDGVTVTYEGVAIGTVDGSLNGVGTNVSLEIDLNASASPEAIEALLESFTFGLSGPTTGFSPRWRLLVFNQAGDSAASAVRGLTIREDVVDDVVDAADGAPDALVNTFTPGSQTSASVADLTGGGYAVVWQSTQQDNPISGNRGIFGQLFSGTGSPLGVEFQVNDIAVGDQVDARVDGLSTGGFVVSWTEVNTGRDGNGWSVWAQRFDADGVDQGPAIQLNEQAESTQYQPRIVALDAGRFMAVWASFTSGASGDGSDYGVFGRVFDANGAPEGGEFQINTTTSGRQHLAKVERLSNGDVMVTWQDENGNDGDGFGVYAQRVSADGDLVQFDGTAAPTAPPASLIADYQLNNSTADSNGDAPNVNITLANPGGLGPDGYAFAAEEGASLSNVVPTAEYTIEMVFTLDDISSYKKLIDFKNLSTNFGLYANNGSLEFFNSTSSSAQVIQAGKPVRVVITRDAATDVVSVYADGLLRLQFTDTLDRAVFDQPNAIAQLMRDEIPGAQNPSGELDLVRVYDAPLTPAEVFALSGSVADERQISGTSAGNQDLPDVAGLTGGEIVFVYAGPDGASDGIYARIYSAAGVAGPEILVSPIVASNQGDPVVLATQNGGFVVGWSDDNGADVLIRRMNADGSFDGNALRVNAQTSGTQDQLELAQLVDGTIVAVWDSTDGSGRGVYQRLLDAPPAPAGAMDPALIGLPGSARFDETDFDGGPQLIDPDGAISLVDMDSADFIDGRLVVSRIVGSGSAFDVQIPAPDGPSQDAVSILNGDGVTVTGATVRVDGLVIGTIVQDGSGGDPLEIRFTTADATPERVERLVERIAYENVSSSPAFVRDYAVQVEDGDGGAAERQLVRIEIGAETDLTVESRGEDEQVNTYVPGGQVAPAAAPLFDALGAPTGHVVVWVSADQDRPSDTSAGIFGQIYGLDGQPVGGEFRVNDFTEGVQTDVDVTGLANGGFVVSWWDQSGRFPTDFNGQAAVARSFAADGTPLGPDFRLSETSVGSQFYAGVAALADGGFAATWMDDGSLGGPGSGRDIFGRTFDADGTPRIGEFLVNASLPGSQEFSEVVQLSNGNLAFVYESPDGSGFGIFARVLDVTGAEVVAEFQVNQNTSGAQRQPQIAALDGGGFVLVWEDQSTVDGSGWSTWQRVYDNDGTARDGAARVNDVTSGSQYGPKVAGLPGGGYVVVFHDDSSAGGTGLDVYAQVYAANGDRVDGNVQVNTGTASTEWQPDVVSLGDGEFAIAFSSFNTSTSGDGSDYGIFQQLFLDPATGQISENPQIGAAPAAQVFAEDLLNATPQLLFPNVGTADLDSSDFDGGLLIVSMVDNDRVQRQFLPGDAAQQDQLGLSLSPASTITVVGADVRVGGVSVGTLTSDGADGAPLILSLNAGASPARIETLIEAITYANTSDDPEAVRQVQLTLTDGDGGGERIVQTVTITPDADGPVPVDDEVQTNSFTSSDQDDSDVATLFDPVSGDPTGYVVTWRSNNQDATGDGLDGVFAQIYDISGAPVGGEFQVNTATPGSQNDPVAIGLATGGFVIAYDSSVPFADVFFQRFDASGVKQGGEVLAVSPSTSQQYDPALTAYANGDFALAFSSQDEDSPFQFEIVVNRYDDQGGFVSQAEIESPTNLTFSNPSLAALDDGRTAVSFQAPDGGSDGIFVQMLDASGALQGLPFRINEITAAQQTEASIAALDTGGFVVAYRSDFGDDVGGTGVFARIYDDGDPPQPVTGEFLVNRVVDSSQYQPSVVGVPGGFAIAFTDANSTDGSSEGIYLQSFDNAGARIDEAVQVNQAFSSTQWQPAIAHLGNGAVAVSFSAFTSGDSGDGSGYAVFHRLLGDPADFSVGGDPILDGINAAVTYDENTINGVPQLIDANGAAAVSDPDSADFDGGALLVSNVIASAPLIDQINAPDDLTQDVLGVRLGGRVTQTGVGVGAVIEVDSIVVGEIVQTGLTGQPLEIRFTAGATPELVEVLVENLTYANASDDPLPTRLLRIQLTDGDGGASEPQLVEVTINPTPDAAVPFGPERQANTETSGDQDFPAITTLTDPGTGDPGDFLLTWVSRGQDGSVDGIYAQRVDRLGNAVAPDGTALTGGASGEFRINATTNNDQFDPAVAGLPDGGFVAIWSDDGGLDGSGIGVFARRFSAAGEAVEPDGSPLSGTSGEFQVNSLTSSTQDLPDIAALKGPNAGEFVAIWKSATSAGAGDADGDGIIGQLYNASGEAVDAAGAVTSAEFVVNTGTGSTQTRPAVEALNDGGFIVIWDSETSSGIPGTSTPAGDGSSRGVFAQRYGADLTPMGGEFQINKTSAGTQDAPRVAVLENGNLAATWVDHALDGSGLGVYAAIYAPDGTTVASEFRVNDQRSNWQYQPDITALDTGGFVVTWRDDSGADGSGGGIFAQQYGAGGARVDSQFQVNTEFSSTQFQPVVTPLLDGGFAIAWTSVTSSSAGDGSGNGVFYQIFANARPQLSDVQAEGDEDTAIILGADVFEGGFVDPDGQTLQAIRVETLPLQGLLSLNGAPVVINQEISIADLQADLLVYQGAQDFFGPDSFVWTGSDGIAFSDDLVSADITVNPVNDAPGLEAGGDATIAEGDTLDRILTLTDPDADLRSYSVDFGDGSSVVTFDDATLAPQISHVFSDEGVFTVTVTVDDNAGEANSVENDSFTVTVENGAPDSRSDDFTAPEDTPSASLSPLDNDEDPGNDPISIVEIDGQTVTVGTPITLSGSGALVTVDAQGDIVYDANDRFETLNDDDTVDDIFTYTIEDDAGLQDTSLITIAVDGANDAPVAQDDALQVNDDATLNGNVFADNGSGADADIDAGATFTVTALNGLAGNVGTTIQLPSGASVSLSSTGDLIYDPTSLIAPTSADSFEYTIADENGATSTATVDIAINQTNANPVAADDGGALFTTDEDTAFTTGDVLANDTDPDAGDVLSVSALNTLGTTGTVVDNGDGTFTYDPNGQFDDLDQGDVATDTFEYTVSDGAGGSDTATVTISIDGANDAPVASAVFANAGEDDGPAVLSANLIDSASDPDESAALFISEVGGAALAVGTAIAGSNGGEFVIEANGQVTFDPAGDFEGLALNTSTSTTIVFTVADGFGGESDAPLTVTIAGANDSPDAVDDAFLIGRDQVLTGDVFDDNANGPDTDPDSGATFSVVAVDGLAANVNSPVDLGGGDTVRVLADGTLTYEQNGVFSGLAAGSTAQRTFTYTIRDDQGVEDTATATITITGNANNPVAVNDAYAIEENETINGDLLDGTGSGGTPDSDADPSDVLSIFAINGDQVSVGATIELTAGSALTVNADGTFTYNPGTAFDPLPDGGAGQETFEYTVTDGLGGFDTGMVTIDVAGLNDAPDARDDDYGILEDDLQLSESVFTNNGDGVDLDVDAGSSFTVSAVDGDDQVVGTQITLDSGALLTLNADGSFTYLPNGAFDTLSLGDNAEDTFEYTITDDQGDSDTATATVQISGENDAPIAADDSVTVSEGGTIDFDVITGSDTDVDQNDTLTVVEINGAAGPVGGTTSLGSGAQLTVNADGNVTYDPDGNFETLAFGESTTESFTYRISDGRGGTDIATVEVTIEGENDAPEVAALDATFTEDETGRQVDLLDAASITDIDASDDLDVQNVTVSGARTVDFTVDDETGLFDIDDGQFEDLAQGTSETFTIDYEVTDGIAIVANTATVTITGVNDAPEATALDETFGEDETGRQVDLLDPASVSDVDAGTDLDVQNVQVTSPRGLTFTVDEETGLFDLADGQFEDLADGAAETFTIDYEVTDGIVAVVNTATITIEGANDAPDVLALDETFGEDETGRQVALLDPASVSDVDMGDDLDVQNLQVTSPRALTFSLDAETGLFDLDDGQFEDLAVGETETFTIDYEVTDGIAAVSNSATITIVGANDQPDAVDDGGVGYFTDENNAVTVGSVLDNDTDADGSDVLSVLSVDTTGTLGQVTSLGNGLFDYDPNGAFSALGAGQTGTDTFEYTIGDGNGGTDTATVTVTIAGVGDAPGNIAPVFTSPSFIGTFENTAALLNIAVFDPDGPQPATFSLGGPDAALFNLDATTGALEFKAAPDFETPLDIGGTPGDNLYEISITADDGGVNGATTQGFVVEVFDVDETITIVGTPGYDRLQGSGADEVFQPLGGPLDVLYLGGGVDVVEFGPETSNGVRDVTYLYEFGADDFIDIGDRAIASEINAGGSTYLTLSGDFDLIAMIGTPDFTDDQLL